MAIERVYALRGATTVEKDSETDIIERTVELVKEIVQSNGLNANGKNVVFCTISSTADITAFYPARAIRESGVLTAPVFSCLEPPIKDSLPLCVRVMLEVADSNKAESTPCHVYLHGAKILRKDLTGFFSVAIDGPSGAGKSTIAKQLSARLNMTYLDTGAMYRAIALKMYENKITSTQTQSIEKMLAATKIDIKYQDGIQRVLLDGKDVSDEIRKHYVSKLASDFSAVKQVRVALVDMQRALAKNCDCILDGRDIGTFVLPYAAVKFYLTASAKVRATRRFKELAAKGESCDLQTVEKDIIARDYNDMNRDFAPLRKAEDAVEVNSDNMNVEEVVEYMVKIIEEKRGK